MSARTDPKRVRASDDNEEAQTIADQLIELDHAETQAIESVLHNDDMEDGIPAANPGLLLKVGSALLQFNERTAAPDAVRLAVTENEAWLLRERVPISLQVGAVMVGLSLKLKIYGALLAFAAIHAAGGILQSDEASTLQRDREAKVMRLGAWRESIVGEKEGQHELSSADANPSQSYPDNGAWC